MKARCLCDSVQIEAEIVSNEIGACHCSMCRKISSSPFFAIDCGDKVTFVKGEDQINYYESSDWGKRASCKKCGSSLFYLLNEPKQYYMSAGIFDDQSKFKLTTQIYIDNKPDSYCFADETKNFTEKEFLELYS